MNDIKLFNFFAAHTINYTLFKHNPVFTTHDKLILENGGSEKDIPGMHSKNLFLKDANNQFFLVSVGQEKRVDLKALSDALGCGRFSFGKPEALFEYLKIEPGSVNPFGLMFDINQKVSFVLDEDFMVASFVNFHPMRNDMTVGLAPQEFLKTMELMHHSPRIVPIPVKVS
jgi:Ala-tRNA(Pro) deacylase